MFTKAIFVFILISNLNLLTLTSKHNNQDDYSPFDNLLNENPKEKTEELDDEKLEEFISSLDDKKLEDLLEELFTEREKKNGGGHHNKQQEDVVSLSSPQTPPQQVKSCFELMNITENKILHTKESIANGAHFLDITFIPKSDELVMHEKCMDYCCKMPTCDSALLSLKDGQNGFRCYLFNCSSKCIFVKHDDYVIMQMGEQQMSLSDASVVTTTSKTMINDVIKNKVITTSSSVSSKSSVSATTSKALKNLNREKEEHEVLAGTSTAIVFLVVGISLTIGFFVYFMVNMNNLNKKFRWPRFKQGKNASTDAEADYLINGMYL